MPPMFGRSKSAKTVAEGADGVVDSKIKKSKSSRTAAEGADVDNSKIKKSKSFKRIRGFLKGESRKERKARKEAAKAAASGSTASAEIRNADEDELSTIYGVDVDDRSVATGAAGASANFLNNESLLEERKTDDAKKAFILKIVLLLMDPETRRFELLQLEFDSLKALVSDVLAQIPVSVTEEALRVQSYTGIAGKDGVEMVPSLLLATFCTGNEVLVAIPDGVPAKECARLARPILSDEKVVKMVGWKWNRSIDRAHLFFLACLDRVSLTPLSNFTFFAARFQWHRRIRLEGRSQKEEKEAGSKNRRRRQHRRR